MKTKLSGVAMIMQSAETSEQRHSLALRGRVCNKAAILKVIRHAEILPLYLRLLEFPHGSTVFLGGSSRPNLTRM